MSSGAATAKSHLADTESGAAHSGPNRSEDPLKSIFQRLESSEKSLAAVAGGLTSGGRVATSANADNLSDAEVRYMYVICIYIAFYLIIICKCVVLFMNSILIVYDYSGQKAILMMMAIMAKIIMHRTEKMEMMEIMMLRMIENYKCKSWK